MNEIIQAALQGDQQAFTSLYTQNYPRVFKTLYSRTRDREEAEDLAQQTFATAFLKLSQFRGDSQFSTWLHRIALNQFLMAVRRVPRISLVSLDAPLNSATRLTVEGKLRYEDKHSLLSSKIRECIKSLAPGQRDIFLRRLNGDSIKEIALSHNCSPGNIKSQYHRARKTLKWKLRAIAP